MSFPKMPTTVSRSDCPNVSPYLGEGWHASLTSLTVPDQGQSNAVIAADPHTKIVRFKYPQIIRSYQLGSYRRVTTPTAIGKIELEDIMNTKQIVATGSDFWKRVMQEVRNNIVDTLMKKQVAALVSHRDERPIISVRKSAMPRLTWKEDILVIHAVSKKNLLNVNQINMVEFYINLDIALKFGLLLKKSGGGTGTSAYTIGPNLQYTLPSETYDDQTMPSGSDFRSFYNWEGEEYVGVNYTNNLFTIMTVENVKWMTLHKEFDWHLNNLNASFEKVVGTRKRTVSFPCCGKCNY